jgi:hypothetical protein
MKRMSAAQVAFKAALQTQMTMTASNFHLVSRPFGAYPGKLVMMMQIRRIWKRKPVMRKQRLQGPHRKISRRVVS